MRNSNEEKRKKLKNKNLQKNCYNERKKIAK